MNYELGDKMNLKEEFIKLGYTEEDYEKIKTLPNIDYVVEDDVFIDSGVPITNNDRSFFGNLLDINNFKGDLTYGRMPENENEIILKINENNFYVKEEMNEFVIFLLCVRLWKIKVQVLKRY